MFLPKKSFSIKATTAFAILCCLFFVLSTLSVMAHSGGEVTSKKTATPITIDGILDEAEWDATFQESSPLQDIVPDPRDPKYAQEWYQIIPGGGAGSDTNDGGLRVSRGKFDDDADMRARWATLWDDDYLYFGFDVTDDTTHPYINDIATRAGEIDGIFLMFDTKHDAPVFEFPHHEFDTKHVANNSVYEADDNYWIFGPLTTEDRSGVWSQALGAALDPELGDLAKGHVVSQKTSSGYSIEMRLPWSIFEPFFGEALTPTDGLVIGFDITITDIDGDAPGTYAAPLGGAVAWSSDFENDNSPGVFGDLFISSEMISSTTPVNPAGKLSTTWGKIKHGYK